MIDRKSRVSTLVAALLLAASGAALAQAGIGQRVSGAELEAWFAADEMAVAGYNLTNQCHWINKGPKTARRQTVYCPGRDAFSVVGEARIEGDRLCSRFLYPDGSKLDACQELFRVGDNKYEARLDGVARNVMYRLIP